MGLYIGNTRIQEVKLGNQTISAIYVGTNKIFPDEYVLSSYTFTVNETYVSLNNSGGGYRIYVTSNRTNTEGVQSYVEYEIKSHPSEVEVFKYDDSFSLKTTAASLSSNTVILRQKYSNKEISIYVTVVEQQKGYIDYEQLTEDGVYLLRGDFKAIKPSDFLVNEYNIEAISAILIKDYRGSFMLSKWSFNRWYDKMQYALDTAYYHYPDIELPNLQAYSTEESAYTDSDMHKNYYELNKYIWFKNNAPSFAQRNTLCMNNYCATGLIPAGKQVEILLYWYNDIKYIFDTWLPDDCPNINQKVWSSTLHTNIVYEGTQNGNPTYYRYLAAWGINLQTKQIYKTDRLDKLPYIDVYDINDFQSTL